MKVLLILAPLWSTRVSGFAPNRAFSRTAVLHPRHNRVGILYSTPDNNDEDETKDNPYQDPNYPDLEFVDYSNPEYFVDQGMDESYREDDTEEMIEAMREERRRRNDEFQFETYFCETLKNGDEYKGEWTVYTTDFENLDSNGFPRFKKARNTLKVISKGYKVIVDPHAEWRVDGERIRHEEVAVPDSESDPIIEWLDVDQASAQQHSPSKELDKFSKEAEQLNAEIMANTYWPEEMSSFDLRGHQGNMCVGNAYTICTSVKSHDGPSEYEGPFTELRTELGIQSEHLRLRVKFDYRVDENAKDEFPPLNLKSMTVCRETLAMWPRECASKALFGAPGATGGLYDPPPVGGEEQYRRYMLLDLEGGATLLFPYTMDQHPDAFDGNGWVTSLDWSPGNIRYQVDRKVPGGKGLMGLRTLELSQVQGSDADRYRPRDGGLDMRQ